MADNVALEIVLSARDITGKAFASVGTGLGNLRSAIFSIEGALSGLGIAAMAKEIYDAGVQVEGLDRAFAAISGSSSLATDELDFIRKTAMDLGSEFYSTADAYKGLFASSKDTIMEGQKTRDIFVGIMDAGIALGKSQDDINGMLNAVTQMMSKGKVQAEELRGQLGERLPGAFKIAADAMGVSTSELDKMLSSGKLLAEDLLPKMAKALQDKYGKAALDSSGSATAAVNRFKTSWIDLSSEIAKSGFMDAISDVLGDVTKDMQGLGDWVSNNKEDINEFFENTATLIKGVGKAALWTGSHLDDFIKLLGNAVPGSSLLLTGLKSIVDKEDDDQSGKRYKIPSREKTDNKNKNNKNKSNTSTANTESKEELNKRKKLLDEFNDEYTKITTSASDYALSIIKKEAIEYKKAGASKIDVDEWVRLSKEKILEDQNAEMRKIQEQFADEYKRLTLSSYDYERGMLDKKVLDYKNAGIAEVTVLEFAGIEKKRILDEESKAIEEASRQRLVDSKYWLDGATRGLLDYSENASDAAMGVEQAFSNAFNGLEDALVSFVTTGKLSFSDLANSIIADIARIAIQQSITGPLASALVSGMGALFSGGDGYSTGVGIDATSSNFAYSAKGNIFDSGIKAFAKGGIFTNKIYQNPTVFKFGQGGSFGVMGEAGAEAVMPLVRTSSGDLGVRSGGGSKPIINVTINNQAKGATGRVESMTANESGGLDLSVIIEQIGGAMASGIGSGRSALSGALESQYGLNRAYGSMR